MKRLIALALLLAAACLTGCGKKEADKSGQATKAKELYTFAGLEWDTPISECEAALEKGTGVQFTRLEEPAPDDPVWADPAYFWDGATFAANPGHYTILGMTIDATGASSDYVPGIAAYYAPADGEAERKLDMIRIRSIQYDLPADPGTGRPDWSQLKTAQEVFREVDKRYGDNTCVYLTGYTWDDLDVHYYTVPEKELPYLFQDAVSFAEAMGWDFLCIGLAQDNVDFYIVISFFGDSGWNYAMTLEYLDCPFTESTFGRDMAVLAVPFPWLNGKPEYTVINP